jgi:UDP:flavonoid glycosyltransferase YjiC (YdhE family)
VRVLVSSTSGYGHVLPMLTLAGALQERGHEVLWATGANACPLVQAAGLEAVEAGLTDAEAAPMRAAARQAAVGIPPQDIPTVVFPLLFGAARAAPMLAALLPVAREWRPDLLVHEHGELAAPLVASVLGVPHAVHAFGGGIPVAILADGSRTVTELWSQHGLPMPPYAGCFEHLYLDICPASLQTVPLDHIPAVQAARPVTYDGEQVADLDSLIPEDDGRPLVYLTLGTVNNQVPVLRRVAEAVWSMDVRLLVTVGHGVDPAALGPVPRGVRLQTWVPQAEVLPLCSAVVSHGGSGTLLATAALGLPQVVLPQAADQFRNAEGLVRAGAGLALHPDDATAEAIADAARAVLDRADLHEGARRVRDEIAAMPGPDEVVDRLELLSRG